MNSLIQLIYIYIYIVKFYLYRRDPTFLLASEILETGAVAGYTKQPIIAQQLRSKMSADRRKATTVMSSWVSLGRGSVITAHHMHGLAQYFVMHKQHFSHVTTFVLVMPKFDSSLYPSWVCKDVLLLDQIKSMVLIDGQNQLVPVG
jgi:hypothetical protein